MNFYKKKLNFTHFAQDTQTMRTIRSVHNDNFLDFPSMGFFNFNQEPGKRT